jgi:hypothetical protein
MIVLLLGVIICPVGASSTKMGFYTLDDWLNVIFLLISDLKCLYQRARRSVQPYPEAQGKLISCNNYAPIMYLFCIILYSMKIVHMKFIHMFFPVKKTLEGSRFRSNEDVGCGGAAVLEAVQGAVQRGSVGWYISGMPASLLMQTFFSGLCSFTKNSP